MKLYITKSQARGLMGGVKFEFKARAELTPEESELVRKYRASKELLLKIGLPKSHFGETG